MKETLLAFKDNLCPSLTPKFINMLSFEVTPGSSCDLIGQLPLHFHGDADHTKDHSHLNSIIHGHLLFQKAGYLLPTLQAVVSHISSLLGEFIKMYM